MNKMTRSNCNDYSSSGCANFSSSSTSSNTVNSRLSLGMPVPVSELPSSQFRAAKYSIFEIANWFLSKESMTHKKLQKLCYYAQAWFYALKNIRLADTIFEAWTHGPVSPVLYDKFKAFGFSAIKMVDNDAAFAFNEEDIELLESIWKTYGDRTGNALESLSHSEPPWIEARSGYAPNERCEKGISPDSMKTYYRSIYLGTGNGS